MIYHYWVGNISGVVFSTSPVCPQKNPLDRLKYIGYSEDMGWPKRMNTGRLFHKGNAKTKKALRRKRKKLLRNAKK